MIGEYEHRTRCVVTNTRKCEQVLEGVWHVAAMILDDGLGGLVEVSTASRIAESAPQREQVTEWRASAVFRSRIRVDESEELPHDSINLGLLRHHLAHEDVPAIARRSPRQFTELRQTPCEQGVDESRY